MGPSFFKVSGDAGRPGLVPRPELAASAGMELPTVLGPKLVEEAPNLCCSGSYAPIRRPRLRGARLSHKANSGLLGPGTAL